MLCLSRGNNFEILLSAYALVLVSVPIFLFISPHLHIIEKRIRGCQNEINIARNEAIIIPVQKEVPNMSSARQVGLNSRHRITTL